MKKPIITAIVTVACAADLFTGCGAGGMLGMEMSDDGASCSITFDQASKDDSATVGTLSVGNGEAIYVDETLEEGSATVAFFSNAGEAMDDISADPEDLEGALSEENAVLQIDLAGEGEFVYEIAPGEYYLSVTALEKTTGTADISVGPVEAAE